MKDAILSSAPLGFPWQTPDPFLFCAYHDDAYPAGNELMGPKASLEGRTLGNDFEGKGGWRMYHGENVPGFPPHPHRGFETVTIVRRGLIDHADSLGAAARFGGGDVQWITAGSGIVHSEMFPLLDREGPNPLELFQIWLNLPKSDKLTDPHFVMLWNRDVPVKDVADAAGRITQVTVVSGAYAGVRPPSPPPHSWAARPDADVAIWTIRMAPNAQWTLPAAAAGSNRNLYYFRGKTLSAEGREIKSRTSLSLRPDSELILVNGPAESELLLLQGRPIAEPVAQYGPFVMNSRQEIEQAFTDYQSTRFGGWPWPNEEPVHARGESRFAKYPDGRVERPA
jgi:redox-sensitive bicupin YhaK (pirin superfamily)